MLRRQRLILRQGGLRPQYDLLKPGVKGTPMADVVVRLPVRDDAEERLFGAFLNRFIESRGEEAERWAANSDAPYVMVRSDPQPGVDMKVLIFQQARAAREFSRGWARVLTGRK